MSDSNSNDSLLDMYIFETSQNIELLEQSILSSEQSNGYSNETINEIFRLMHTIKGSSAMMFFNEISKLAHSIEDVFYFLRENPLHYLDYSNLNDLILEGIDFIKLELEKIKNGDQVDGDAQILIQNIRDFLEELKKVHASGVNEEKPIFPEKKSAEIVIESIPSSLPQNSFKATIFFKEGCEMENIRAFAIINNLNELTHDIHFFPSDILENDESVKVIRENGFVIYFKVEQSYEEMYEFFMQTIFLEKIELIELEDDQELTRLLAKDEPDVKEKEKSDVSENSTVKKAQPQRQERREMNSTAGQSIISVNVAKLDKLMDLVGEMVIAEAMVLQNPDLDGLDLENFQKASRQLHKITTELQDMVMAIRMVPLANTFHKMHRIVRDMSKKLDKEVKLEIIGEETEVDKNIIEHISDPLMHLVRNSVDHGIEESSVRISKEKPKVGTLTLEAKNAGGDVLILIKDDGRGLNKEKLLAKAMENDLLTKSINEMTDREIYNLIFTPGFSTKDKITEYSGRGVGMDVVVKNIEAVGGSASVDSIEGIGTTVTLKIPLTLAIIDGMNIQVGNSSYTIPIMAIKESFRVGKGDIFSDPDGNEMIIVRGECYPILRLHEYFDVKNAVTEITEGILIMVGEEERTACLFADELVGQQQVVVKALPNYIKNTRKIEGLTGCTLLGDGSISLILDIGGLINLSEQREGSFG